MKNHPYNPRADNAGREPQAGDFVAYNYSGQIATGFIKRKGKDGKTFIIEQVDPENGHESRVRGPKCLLVLARTGEAFV